MDIVLLISTLWIKLFNQFSIHLTSSVPVFALWWYDTMRFTLWHSLFTIILDFTSILPMLVCLLSQCWAKAWSCDCWQTARGKCCVAGNQQNLSNTFNSMHQWIYTHLKRPGKRQRGLENRLIHGENWWWKYLNAILILSWKEESGKAKAQVLRQEHNQMSGKFQNAVKSIMFSSQSWVEEESVHQRQFGTEDRIWSQIGKQKKNHWKQG